MKKEKIAELPAGDIESRTYAAPALEKGLDIIEMLAASEAPLTQKDIAARLGRSVGEIYRMLSCLVSRHYVAQVEDNAYVLTTKLFELAHLSPPTHRLLLEAQAIMHRLARDLDQSCHLTIYDQGRQIVLHKVDSPGGMGFSMRVGMEVEVLHSASGRVLLAFQNPQTRALRVEESRLQVGEDFDPQVDLILDGVQVAGYESFHSAAIRGLYAIAFPVLDTQGHAIAALSVPYAERIDQSKRKSIPEATETLREAARALSKRMGGV